METKELKITAPEGYEIDQEHSSFEKIVFKPIENKLPKTWEEFCKTYPIKGVEAFIVPDSSIRYASSGRRDRQYDKNILTDRETAEAMLALCQLIQLIDCYNDGWKPDWKSNKEYKYCIEAFNNKISAVDYYSSSRVLSFKTEELRDQFLENFRDLIEIAKPLI